MELEKNIKRMEEIAVKLEDPSISIDQGVELYSEGVELAKTCLSQLKDVRGKITVIRKQLEEFKEEPLD